jgi:UDP-3-O-[3-hydroxymyristoyl] glucosamine N-acyltransferase
VKLGELASLVGGEILGDRDIEISGVSGINDAKRGDITFISARKYLRDLSRSSASCIIVKEPIPGASIAQLKVSNPHLAFLKLLEHFNSKPSKPLGVSKDAIVSGKATIGNGVSIYPLSYIADGVSIGNGTVIHPYVYIGENTQLGEECTIYPNVTLRENIKVGNRVIIHSGSVIGSDGFGYVFDGGRYHKIPQVGRVMIEDDVEIGSNTSIDRATTGNTIIGKGTKIDNLVQVGHNVKIGSNSILCGQVGVAGSSELGDYVTVAGQVGISDHIKIDSEARIGAQSGVISNLKKGTYSGYPAILHRDWLKAQAIFSRLPGLYKKIKELEQKIRELERRDAG